MTPRVSCVQGRRCFVVMVCFCVPAEHTPDPTYRSLQVLSDPQKRELYDQLGETGMMMMEDPFAAKEVRPS